MGNAQKGNIEGNTKKDERINEKIIQNKPPIEIDLNLHEVLKSICKIRVLFNNSYIIGTGFLIKLFKKVTSIYCLMTCEHTIKKEMIESKKGIEVYYDKEQKKNTIILNKDERYIDEFSDLGLDITIIEILNKDKINEEYYLLPDLDYNNLEEKEIYIPQYPRGKKLSYSEGKIININNYEIIHNASTLEGSSGSPIFLKNTTRVIGIHKEGNKTKEENYGNFIYHLENILNEKIIYLIDGLNFKGKYIVEKDIYYKEKNNMKREKKKMIYLRILKMKIRDQKE